MGNSKIFMFGLNQENYKKSGIYQIRNTVNGKFYIGSAIDFSKRFCVHYNRLINNKHCNIHLQNAWNLYGHESFEFIIIEFCEKSILLEREQYYLDLLTPYDSQIGYNICKKSTSRMGVKEDPRTTEKRREIQKEVMSRQDVRQKILLTNRTEETRIKRSLASSGRKWNDLSKKIFSEKKKDAIFKSGGFSEQTRERMSISKKGKSPSNIKSVIQYDLDGKELNTFKSIADAVIFLRDSGFKISASKISLCISGKRNKAGGFVWKEYYPISSLTLT